MTVRQGKRLTWFFGALVVAAIILDGVTAYLRPDRFRLMDLAAPVMMLALFLILRRRYADLEAAHGLDYDQPIPNGRRWIILLGGLLAVGAGLAAYLLATR